MSTDFLEETTSSIESDSAQVSQKRPNKFSTRSFTKTVVRPGDGFLRPYIESVCVLDISHMTIDEDISDHFESFEKLQIPVGKQVELILGSAENEAMRIVDKCVMTMKKGEESQFILNLGAPHCDKRSSVAVNIILHKFSETEPTWSLDSDRKHQLALMHKEKGTNYFNSGKTEAAFYQYSITIYYLICIPECTSIIDEKLKVEVKSKKEMYIALKCVCYLNMAACQMKVGNCSGVIRNCTHALSLNSSSVKGLYRRAQANVLLGRVNEARSDLNRALTIEPKNRAVAALLESCKQQTNMN